MQQFADMMRLGNEGIPERRKLLEEHELKLIEQAQTIHQTLEILRGKIDYYRSWEEDTRREA